MKKAKCLEKFDLFYAGVHFGNLDVAAKKPPKTASYTIRMNQKLVDETERVMDALYARAPRADVRELPYLSFGFAALQVHPSTSYSL